MTNEQLAIIIDLLCTKTDKIFTELNEEIPRLNLNYPTKLADTVKNVEELNSLLHKYRNDLRR